MAHAYRTGARIEAPADVVWQILSDVERMPAWTTAMSRVTLLGPETALVVGSRVEIDQPGLPAATWEVDGLAEGQGFSWSSSSTPGVRTGIAHRITPQAAAAPSADAACEVTTAVARSGMLAGLTDLAGGPRARELADTLLADLKAEAELRVRDKG
ncbi:SRPBCC family protein [Promicromonospora sp. MEB111]|uniref:SRPBCC family protein n=1 Tax=Promicromonospora sp. MEB111 TaxID=3040301 RepID=UPI00254A4972|nr:SRPBCC family protein [Promicromonospora sp. MEB111]